MTKFSLGVLVIDGAGSASLKTGDGVGNTGKVGHFVTSLSFAFERTHSLRCMAGTVNDLKQGSAPVRPASWRVTLAAVWRMEVRKWFLNSHGCMVIITVRMRDTKSLNLSC